MSKDIEKKIVEKFKSRESFSREELLNFYKRYEPELKEGTFGWRIYNLKSRKVIKSIQRGHYVITDKPEYEPEISEELLKIANWIEESYTDLKYCIWDSSWLNEFSRHQSGKKIIIIEVEEDLEETIFFNLKDYFEYDLYLNPNEKEINFYISESSLPVVVKRIITRAPIVKRKKDSVQLPMLEKIMVDIFVDTKLFYFYQGAELGYLYEGIMKRYTINYTKLISYARRRKKMEEVKAFLLDDMQEFTKDIIK